MGMEGLELSTKKLFWRCPEKPQKDFIHNFRCHGKYSKWLSYLVNAIRELQYECEPSLQNLGMPA
jgi:hypothetical protein